MLIHVLPPIKGTPDGKRVVSQIRKSGHVVSQSPDLSDFVVGLPSSPWLSIPSIKRVILKDPNRVDTVPSDAVLFDLCHLVRDDDPNESLCDFFRKNGRHRHSGEEDLDWFTRLHDMVMLSKNTDITAIDILLSKIPQLVRETHWGRFEANSREREEFGGERLEGM